METRKSESNKGCAENRTGCGHEDEKHGIQEPTRNRIAKKSKNLDIIPPLRYLWKEEGREYAQFGRRF